MILKDLIDKLDVISNQKYTYNIGNSRTPKKLPSCSISYEESQPYCHQSKSQESTIKLEFCLEKTDQVQETIKFCDDIAKHPDRLLGDNNVGITNIIPYNYKDIGDVTDSSIYKIEQRLDILVED